METLKYLISLNGGNVAVGIVGPDESAKLLMNLAHNLFKANSLDELYNGVIYLKSAAKFYELLIYQEYFAIWDEHNGRNKVSGHREKSDARAFLKRAFKRARLIWESNVSFVNFIQQMYRTPVHFPNQQSIREEKA